MFIPSSKKLQLIFKHLAYADILDLFYQSSIINHFPIAIWRFPGENETQAIIDLTGTCAKVNLEITDIPRGFIFSPFLCQRKKRSLFIKSNLYIKNSTCTYFNDPGTQDYSHITANKLHFENTLADLLKKRKGKNIENRATNLLNWFPSKTGLPIYPSVTKEAYCHWVEQAKERIKSDEIDKIVLSRTIIVNLNENFDPLSLYNKLTKAYPNAFISLVAIPAIGTWIGVSPELLLSVNKSELITVALAGTQSVNSNSNLSNIKWGDKELKEHALVSDFIRNCFFKQNITSFTEQGPETVQAGNLLHLQTKFHLNLSQVNHNDIANRILMDLHPTPAVCGSPKREALDFILDHETHDREFYTGFLGPVNLDNQSHLFVNLRCLQLKTASAILYAGSGITIDSFPEKEWLEAELKLNTLLNILNRETTNARYEISHLTQRVLCDESI